MIHIVTNNYYSSRLPEFEYLLQQLSVPLTQVGNPSPFKMDSTLTEAPGVHLTP